jgi:hypothetical protein
MSLNSSILSNSKGGITTPISPAKAAIHSTSKTTRNSDWTDLYLLGISYVRKVGTSS